MSREEAPKGRRHCVTRRALPIALGARAILLAMASIAAGGCATLRRDDHFTVRYADYLEQRLEVSPAVAEAMAAGHVIAGMDQEQVRVVLGRPVECRSYGGTPAVEVWLYPGHRLHQDHHRSGAATLFRLVFRDGRLAMLEPI